jgi:hypothetical protein
MAGLETPRLLLLQCCAASTGSCADTAAANSSGRGASRGRRPSRRSRAFPRRRPAAPPAPGRARVPAAPRRLPDGDPVGPPSLPPRPAPRQRVGRLGTRRTACLAAHVARPPPTPACTRRTALPGTRRTACPAARVARLPHPGVCASHGSAVVIFMTQVALFCVALRRDGARVARWGAHLEVLIPLLGVVSRTNSAPTSKATPMWRTQCAAMHTLSLGNLGPRGLRFRRPVLSRAPGGAGGAHLVVLPRLSCCR